MEYQIYMITSQILNVFYIQLQVRFTHIDQIFFMPIDLEVNIRSMYVYCYDQSPLDGFVFHGGHWPVRFTNPLTGGEPV